MAAISFSGLALVLGYAVWRHGGVLPAEWLGCLAALGLLAAAHGFFSSQAAWAPPLPLVMRGLLAVLLAASALQVTPLPAGIVGGVSPARAELARALEAVLGPADWVTLSVAPPETMRHVLSVGGYVLVFLLAREICWRWKEKPWRVSLPFVVIAFLEGVLGLVQAYAGESGALARGTYVNRNHYAGLLEMSLPFAVMQAVGVLRRGRKRHASPAGPAIRACGLLAVAAVILLGILYSLSRMGYLATLAALFVMGALALGAGRTSWRRWLPVGVVGLGVVAGFVFLPTDQLIVRFADLAATEEITADMRVEIWRESWQLVAAYPVLGCGLGAYEPAFLRYKKVAPMNRVDFAHNDYLQVLAELGVIGFAAVLALGLMVLGRAVGAGTASESYQERYAGLAAAGALTAILLHSFVDFNLYIPANTMLVAWIGGMAMALGGNGRPRAVGREIGLPDFHEARTQDRMENS